MATATAAPETLKPGRMYIDGAWCDALDGKTIAVTNPATEETLTTMAFGSRADVKRALEAAQKAMSSWMKLTAYDRAKVLKKTVAVVRDNDGGDCLALKARLTQLCAELGRPETLVRLVCQELESWYIADLGALASAFPGCKLDTPGLRKRFAQPDTWNKPSAELERLIPEFQKRSGARLMAESLREDGNRSPSFHAFINGVRQAALDLGYRLPA